MREGGGGRKKRWGGWECRKWGGKGNGGVRRGCGGRNGFVVEVG